MLYETSPDPNRENICAKDMSKDIIFKTKDMPNGSFTLAEMARILAPIEAYAKSPRMWLNYHPILLKAKNARLPKDRIFYNEDKLLISII